MDLVGTCPKGEFLAWIAEGDAVGEPYTGEEWGWYTSHSLAATIKPGDRFYVVAHGKLRGWAPVTRVEDHSHKGGGHVKPPPHILRGRGPGDARSLLGV